MRFVVAADAVDAAHGKLLVRTGDRHRRRRRRRKHVTHPALLFAGLDHAAHDACAGGGRQDKEFNVRARIGRSLRGAACELSAAIAESALIRTRRREIGRSHAAATCQRRLNAILNEHSRIPELRRPIGPHQYGIEHAGRAHDYPMTDPLPPAFRLRPLYQGNRPRPERRARPEPRRHLRALRSDARRPRLRSRTRRGAARVSREGRDRRRTRRDACRRASLVRAAAYPERPRARAARVDPELQRRAQAAEPHAAAVAAARPRRRAGAGARRRRRSGPRDERRDFRGTGHRASRVAR